LNVDFHLTYSIGKEKEMTILLVNEN
jgi:hypothetical protein